MISMRYIVDDVDAAIDFYTRHLGFAVRMRPGPGFALLQRDELRLLLNVPGGGGGAGQSLPDGRTPQPGGWNRFQLSVTDLDSTVAELREQGVPLLGEIIAGRGGRQALLNDPAGNLVEIFEEPAS